MQRNENSSTTAKRKKENERVDRKVYELFFNLILFFFCAFLPASFIFPAAEGKVN